MDSSASLKRQGKNHSCSTLWSQSRSIMGQICNSHFLTQISAIFYTRIICFHPCWLVGEKQLPGWSQRGALIYNGLWAHIKADEPKIPDSFIYQGLSRDPHCCLLVFQTSSSSLACFCKKHFGEQEVSLTCCMDWKGFLKILIPNLFCAARMHIKLRILGTLGTFAGRSLEKA